MRRLHSEINECKRKQLDAHCLLCERRCALVALVGKVMTCDESDNDVEEKEAERGVNG